MADYNSDRTGSNIDAVLDKADNLTQVAVGVGGNVGIGTASPSEKLHLNNASGAVATKIESGTSDARVIFTTTGQQNYAMGIDRTDGKLHITNSEGVGSSQLMTIDSLGNIGIGTTSPSQKLDVEGDIKVSGGVRALFNETGTSVARNKFGFEPTTQWAAVIRADSANSGNAVVFMNSSAGTVGSIGMTTTSTSFNTSSDYRLKENVSEMDNASERVKALKPCRFNFTVDPDKTVDGFLAHEAQEVVPEAVHGTKDGMRTEEYEVTPAVLDDDGNVVEEVVMGTREVPDYQGIDQSKLVPLLTKALQEALERIEILESKY